jgi:hypothetical protein
VVAISDIFSDGVADILDGDDRLIGRGLDSCDVTADLAGGVGGLLGERLDLGGNDGETAASLARAGGFDRRVQGPRRLVCPAMVLMSSSTSPMRAAALDSSPTRSLVLSACSTASRRNAAGGLHLAADLGDQRRHLFGRRSDRLDVGRGVLRCCRDHRGQFLRALCVGRERACGRFQFGRGRRDRLHDLADGAFEVGCEPVHVRPALRGDAALGFLLLRFELSAHERVGLEHPDGTSHPADLVPSRGAWHLHLEFAGCEIGHRRHQ